MSDAQLDIIIDDSKISPRVATKLREIDAAGRAAEGSITRLQAKLAGINTAAVDKLSMASARVTNAAAKQTTATARLVTANTRNETATVKNSIAQQRLAIVTEQAAAAAARSAAATSRASLAATQAEAADLRLTTQKRKLIQALSAQAQAEKAANITRNLGNAQTRQQTQQVQNLAYQLNDIGVSLASGQNPLTVMIQQGSQIATIYGPGKGITGTIRLLAGSLAALVTPMLPAIAVVGTLAAGFKFLQGEIQKTTKEPITFGDTVKAVFQVAGAAIKQFIQPALDWLKDKFVAVGPPIIEAVKFYVNRVVASWVSAFNIVREGWSLLPGVIRDIFARTVNITLSAVESMVDGVTEKLNVVLDLANEASRALGQGDIFGKIAKTDLSRFKMTVGTAVEDMTTIIAKQLPNFSRDFVGGAMQGVVAATRGQAIKNSRARQAAAAAESAVGKQGGNGRSSVAKEELSEQEKLLRSIKSPMMEYTRMQRLLNDLHRQGKISLAEYNAQLMKTQLSTDLLAVDAALPGYEQAAAVEELRIAQQEQLVVVQQAMEAKILTEQQGADRIRAINQKLADDIRAIEVARQTLALSSASSTFDSLAQITEGFAGKQNAIYQTMFVASKAFAIAEALVNIQAGVASALNAPWPLNIAAMAQVAAQGASIMSNLQAVTMSAQGKKDGGYITGPGGPRDDRVPTWLSDGEFVVNAEATKRNRGLLEAINDNRAPRMRDGGLVQAAPAKPGSQAIPATMGRGANGVVVNIYAQDAQSFNASRSQVAANIARAVNMGYRNL